MRRMAFYLFPLLPVHKLQKYSHFLRLFATGLPDSFSAILSEKYSHISRLFYLYLFVHTVFDKNDAIFPAFFVLCTLFLRIRHFKTVLTSVGFCYKLQK